MEDFRKPQVAIAEINRNFAFCHSRAACDRKTSTETAGINIT